MSSEVRPTYSADAAVDGDTGTYWSTVGTAAIQQEYVTVDLGGHYDVGRITLYPSSVPALFPSYFKVKVTNADVIDGSRVWTTVVSEYGYTALPGANSWQVEAIRTRYVKI